MARRTRIGPHITTGEPGVYISHPGVDVANTAIPYLLDSRYKNLDLLTYGAVGMSRMNAVSETIYYATVTIPDLGYQPQFYANMVYTSGNAGGIPVNAAYWPSSGVTFYTNAGNSQFTPQYTGVWMPNRFTICAQSNILQGNVSGNMALYYVVFKNPETA
ncbi:hypothetical protein [Rhizobium grahamii]|uniref:Uncharacterized protein n=1 Tax=Rhizobium grahamii CCGE 502 TaxID=990285 RepID=S3HL42_9HYPH|nr:hypothetical protein [Rhizobium grahamii]EPE99542.1 hypothetical protein RGCCGE502_05145 [Rhizobium grahamii CCGE 502]